MTNSFKNLKDFDRNQYNALRDNVFQISDAYYALKDLQDEVTNPDLARMMADLRDLMDGSVSYFTKTL